MMVTEIHLQYLHAITSPISDKLIAIVREGEDYV
ncbi:MAG: hypothetical protein K0R55_3627 [Sporomusa sp.]|jgi:hypothetical protein|nr:hypothetical protein [Sporomusa sp.]